MPFKQNRPKTGGRKKGTPNKVGKTIKDMILGALEAGGGQAWFEEQMRSNPASFMTVVGKIIPVETKAEVTGANGGPMEWTVAFVTTQKKDE